MARLRNLGINENPFLSRKARQTGGSARIGQKVGYKTKRRNCKYKECAALFTATRSDQIYCSAACRSRAKVFKREQRDKTYYYADLGKKAPGTIDYQNCQAPTCRKTYPRRSNNSKYCSVKCMKAAQLANMRRKYREANPLPVVPELILSPDI